MAKPSFQDAQLMLQLAQWGASSGFGEAANWLWSDQFVEDFAEFAQKYPFGSEGARMAAIVVGFYETVGTLWKHGLLNEDLLFDWLAVAAVWNRIKGFALGVRAAAGNPRLYENFEALANANVAYDTRLAKLAAKGKRRQK